MENTRQTLTPAPVPLSLNKRKFVCLDEYLISKPTKKAKTELDLLTNSTPVSQTGTLSRPKIAIIGTAGRKNDSHNALLSSALFDAMVDAALQTIQTSFGLDPKQCDLVSGGAAWADHVAVQLFLQGAVTGLTIYSPCAFINSTFVDIGGNNWKMNPGKSANYYHSLFSKKIGRDTMTEITTAQDRGAIINSRHFGFHARNDEVAAKATHMIAFSWSETDVPSDGGTLYTWNQCHISNALKINTSLKKLCQSLGMTVLDNVLSLT